MRHILLVTAAMSTFGLASAASAADMSYPVKAPMMAPVPVFSWTGFYIGGHVGYGWGKLKDLPQYDSSQDYFYDSGTSAYDSNDEFYPGRTCGSYCEFDYRYTEGYQSSLDNPDGWFGGVQAGYNYQFTNNVVLGVEADISFGSMKGGGTGSYSSEETFNYSYLSGPDGTYYGGQDITNYEDSYTSLGTKLDYFGTARVRLGYAMDRFLPYITGGLAWAHNEATLKGYSEDGYYYTDYNNLGNVTETGSGINDYDTVNDSDSNYHIGWALGAGLEYAITDNWTIKAEYIYMDLGSETYNFRSADGFDLSTDIGIRLQTAKIGVNYKF